MISTNSFVIGKNLKYMFIHNSFAEHLNICLKRIFILTDFSRKKTILFSIEIGLLFVKIFSQMYDSFLNGGNTILHILLFVTLN